MPDRLEELRHQRALVQEHLTWLEHEIAQVTVTRLTLPPFAFRPDKSGTASRPPTPMPDSAIPELSQFQVDPDNVQGDTRRGCRKPELEHGRGRSTGRAGHRVPEMVAGSGRGQSRRGSFTQAGDPAGA